MQQFQFVRHVRVLNLQTMLFVFLSLKVTHLKQLLQEMRITLFLFNRTAFRGPLSHMLCIPVGQSFTPKTKLMHSCADSPPCRSLTSCLSLAPRRGMWVGASLTSPVALDGGITGLTSLNLTPLLITCRISRLAPRGVLS